MMKTKGELGSEISEGISRFQSEYLGRGPEDIRAHLVDDLVLVRLKGVLSSAERNMFLASGDQKGKELLKEVRRHLLDIARPAIESMVQSITGVRVVTLYHDISTSTGEEIMLFSLAGPPAVRESVSRRN